MKLRIARKIVMSSEERKKHYSEETLQRANIRYNRCRSARENKAYWQELIEVVKNDRKSRGEI